MTECIQQYYAPFTTPAYGDVSHTQFSYDMNDEALGFTSLRSFPQQFPQQTMDITTDIDKIDLDSWKRRHTRHWSNEDLLSFIYSMASDVTNPVKVSGEKFQHLSGHDLYQMSLKDFIKCDPEHGEMIYERLCRQISIDNSGLPTAYCPTLLASSATATKQIIENSQHHSQEQLPYQIQQQPILPKPVEEYISQDTDDDVSRDLTAMRGVVGRSFYNDADRYCNDTDISMTNGPCMMVPTAAAVTRLPSSPDDETCRLHMLQPVVNHHHHHHQGNWPTSSDGDEVFFDIKNDVTYTDLSPSSTYYHQPGLKIEPIPGISLRCHQPRQSVDCVFSTTTTKPRKIRTYTRRSTSSELESFDVKPPCSSTSGLDVDRHRTARKDIKFLGQKPKAASGGKGGHLWEFIRDLLKANYTNTYNDSRCDMPFSSTSPNGGSKIIQWEDRPNGVFRIVNSKEVARLWGEQKDNRKTKMTYEKLSRALRWCRNYGFLANVPKDGRFPKKLCFRFGERATNWRC